MTMPALNTAKEEGFLAIGRPLLFYLVKFFFDLRQ